MIRFFKAFCKINSDRFSDIELFDAALQVFRPDEGRCPYCDAALLAPFGDYERYLVSSENEEVVSRRVTVPRFVCESCGRTHALLPDILIPGSPYSFRFVVSVLISYFRKEMPVLDLCERYGIAVSTLYAWKARFKEQLSLFLGLLKSMSESEAGFLEGLIGSNCLSAPLFVFFRKHSFSFLQNMPPRATRSLSLCSGASVRNPRFHKIGILIHSPVT